MKTDVVEKIAGFANSHQMNIQQQGTGRPLLILHGGAGPISVSAFVTEMAKSHHVIAPTHPGFGFTPRPEQLDTVTKLAALYREMLAGAGIENTLVVGSSIGGWIAAELMLAAPENLAGAMLVDACGIVVPGETVLDVFTTPPAKLADFSFHDADRYRIDPTKLTPQQLAMMKANFETLGVYGGKQNMQDETLLRRLAKARCPCAVVWGESDRVVMPAYGRAYATAIPGASFTVIENCGHLPQMEQMAELVKILSNFEASLTQ